MNRTSYRSSYESLVDDADYQALSPLAQAIFHTLKLKLGMYGIAVLYTGMLEAIHSKALPGDVHMALEELEASKPVSGASGWIRRERHVIWLVNGLKFDPAFTAGNTNNRKGAIAYAQSLPRLAIVNEFLSYYDLSTPSPTPSPTPLPTPTVSTETETETEPETESGKRLVLEQGESTIAVENSAPATNNTPPACAGTNHDPNGDLLASVPVRRFLEAFYPTPDKADEYGTVLERTRRRDDVLRQLHSCLTGKGTKLDKQTVVRAYDIAHLETCCAAIDAGAIRDRDKAIRVLLVKLRDTWAETRALREKPPEVPRRRAVPAGAPTSISELLKQQRGERAHG